MVNFLKRHWFGVTVSIFGGCYLLVFLLVLFAPKQDKMNRGFIPCTKMLVRELFACTENKTWCMAKNIVKNTWCDTKVVLRGVENWAKGRQNTPWANYYFTPLEDSEQEKEDISPELKQYYEENPDIAKQMETLAQQSLEQKLNLEDIENEQEYRN